MTCRPIPRVAVAMLAAALAGCETAPVPPVQNVVLVLVDTLRADHLGCYGYTRDTSPNLDRLAAEGVLFENAYAQSSWTSPSVASLFTSTFPAAHGVKSFASDLDPGDATLAAEFRGRGRRTGAISANIAFIRPGKGFDAGFDHFEMAHHRALPDEFSSAFFNHAPDRAAALTDRALRFLDRSGSKPFFLYLHYIDPHSPYDAPAPHADRYFDDSIRTRAKTEPKLFSTNNIVTAGPDDRALLTSLYDGEIAYTDFELGRLLDGIASRGLAGSTAVVVTSDHGEELFDHGGVMHGETLYREVVRVPLLVRVPGGAAGRRIAAPVQLVDIGPTLLDLAGAPDARNTEGRSLRDELTLSRLQWWLRSWYPAGPAPFGYSELDRTLAGRSARPNHRRAIRVGRLSYLVSESDAAELYDTAADLGETRNLLESEPAAAGDLPAKLQQLDAAERRPRREGVTTAPLDREEEERLRALGYLD